MKVREYEQYRAMYCGLCHTLEKHCGLGSRFLLSYDLCFAAMVLSGSMNSVPLLCRKRCIVSLLRPRACIRSDRAMEIAADCTLILSYGKIEDGIRDEKGLPGPAAKSLKSLRSLKKKRLHLLISPRPSSPICSAA